MSECNETFGQYWMRVKEILLEMSKFYKQIKDGTAEEGIQKQYALRIITLDKNTQCLFNTFALFNDQEQIGHLNNLLNDFHSSFYDNLVDGKALCHNIAVQLYTVANFHVLQQDGDKESWRSLQNKYEELLRNIPTQ